MGREKSRTKDRSRRSRSPSPSRKDDHKHKHKGHRHRKGRYSSDDDASDHDQYKNSNRSEPDLNSRLEEESTMKEHLKDQLSKHKEWLKAVETPEEKRARRLKKKEAKEKKRREQMGWGEEEMGYSNTNNPFGDNKLLATFKWDKKLEKEGIREGDDQDFGKRQRQRQEETKLELEKVKRRRMERELERAARDEEMTFLQREKETAMFQGWEKQEDEFHLNQAKLRSKIRIEDNRAKPIDLLAAYVNPHQVNPNDDNLELQMNEPYGVLVGLSIDDLEDLVEDIKVYMTLEQGNNAEFWQDMTIVAKDEVEKLKKKQEERGLELESRRDVINTAVQQDVTKILKGKTYTQLIALQKQIQQKIKAGGAIDIGYWESLLQQLKAHMAKARLKEKHQKLLREKILELKQQSLTEDNDNEEAIQVKQETSRSPSPNRETSRSPSPNREIEESVEQENPIEENPEEEDATNLPDKSTPLPTKSEEEMAAEAYDEYDEGGYSPRLVPFSDVDQAKWIDADNDIQKLEYLRMQIRSGSTVEEEEESNQIFNSEANKSMGEGEEAFNVPVSLPQKIYQWKDKYRPRKPRFFNRVHTGYEWNKYNQTHYDTENPPPKIVQGYKFNIFYPDLIEKTSTPEYHLIPSRDDKDFGTLRFTAGPPYEDIAFKVVNREWELSHKHGFRCQFHNNVFQLWFHFKRYRYRR